VSTDPRDMAARGRIGAYVTNGRYSGTVLTTKARRTFIDSFAERARSEAAARGEEITDDEAARRGEFLRRAHYARLAMRSVESRRRKAA
jgi:hypothetical protein